MSIIRIIANNTEIDFVKESLTIKKENSSFSTDLRISHSSFPFLVIENEKTNLALGTIEMTSILKKKIIPVTVIEMGDRYPGELQILSSKNGFRKCNLRYGLEPLDILEKQLSDLLPVLSVKPGETNPVPFTEENISLINGYQYWETWPLQFAGKIYPEVKFQFPQMAWENKFFEERPVEEEEEWFYYLGYYNKFKQGSTPKFEKNFFTQLGEGGEDIQVTNTNVPSPQLFLLAILEYAFSNIGWQINGPFVENDFIKRLLVLSLESNLCKVLLAPASTTIDFTDLSDRGQFFYHYYTYDFIADFAGTYTFSYDVVEPLRNNNEPISSILFKLVNDPGGWGTVFQNSSNIIYKNTNDPDNLHFMGTFDITISEEEVGVNILVGWGRFLEADPNPISFVMNWSLQKQTFNMMHPTVALGRYAPKWTLATFINELKKKFCLQVDFDNAKKIVFFDFAKKNIGGTAPYVLRDNLAISEYDMPQYNAFILKNSNDEDTTLYISKEGVVKNKTSESDLTSPIESQFKLVPYNGFTADLSGMEDKDGVGLMLFNPQGTGSFELPLIVPDFNGQTLAWEGKLGIYNLYWKDFIQFRLNASSIKLSGPFTEIEIAAIDRIKKIHTGHQAYMVKSMDYSESKQGYYKVNLELESINL